MIAANLPEIVRRMLAAERALDVGGWDTQLNAATHVLDYLPYETRIGRAHDPQNSQRFTKESWVQLDINGRERWPFPDRYFDFCMCSHVLEDVRDPVWVVSELARVSRAGYLETPKAAKEILAPQKGLRPGTIGGAHHRWFVEFDRARSRVVFRMKPYDLFPRGLLVRYWTALFDHHWHLFNQGFFWSEQLQAEEIPYSEETSYEYVRSLQPEARSLIFFAPVSRVVGKTRRTLRR